MNRFEYTDPGQIDGDPLEVADEVRELCERLASLNAVIVESAYKQLRNAGLSDQLAAGDEPDEEVWKDSAAGYRAEQMVRKALLFAQALREV